MTGQAKQWIQMPNIDNKILIKTIQNLNQHLPAKRRSLAELLEDSRPGVKGKDNTFYAMDRPELELIAESIPRFLWPRLKLPMLIEMSPDLGSGSARIQGEVESEAVSKILDLKRDRGGFLIIYMPEVRDLRRKLPTTTQYAFVASIRDLDEGI
ncbi:MAG: hypothetical protein A4E45_01206 [Methanosaeta sp. PtaB.Bin039]|nr:MAG: hypothetical protein A4E45_01206 [Methanosaeta sp. PtaB.Bin039]OPY47400.1 MAG: hypothetical protein A4E47_00309 [Methanosaeta sp. PtaU1.Bin028]